LSNRGYNRTLVTAVVKTEVNKIKGRGLTEVTTCVKTEVTAEVKTHGMANVQSESKIYGDQTRGQGPKEVTTNAKMRGQDMSQRRSKHRPYKKVKF
jgi:hypothetical protein